ncbi:MAG: AtpZ/AtpI family protein [Planctomycetota bacterium]
MIGGADMAARRKRPLGLDEMDELGQSKSMAGIVFGVTVVLFSLGGFALDRWLGTLPLFLLIGLAVGSVGGFIYLVETVSPGTLFPKRRPKGPGDDDEAAG